METSHLKTTNQQRLKELSTAKYAKIMLPFMFDWLAPWLYPIAGIAAYKVLWMDSTNTFNHIFMFIFIIIVSFGLLIKRKLKALDTLERRLRDAKREKSTTA